jgi:hypothetical protein
VVCALNSELPYLGRLHGRATGDPSSILGGHSRTLTWHATLGAFLGDTVNRKAVINRFDWKKAWEDGCLDRALQDVIDGDAAINGCRPEFVELDGVHLLATADYGDIHPDVRLYHKGLPLSSSLLK